MVDDGLEVGWAGLRRLAAEVEGWEKRGRMLDTDISVLFSSDNYDIAVLTSR